MLAGCTIHCPVLKRGDCELIETENAELYRECIKEYDIKTKENKMNIEQLDKANSLKKRHDEVIHRLECLAKELEYTLRSNQFSQSELNDVVKTIETIVTALLTQKREKLVKDFAEKFEEL